MEMALWIYVSTSAFIILNPVVISDRVKKLVWTEAHHVRLGVADQAGGAHVLEHRLLPCDPVGEFFVQFLAWEEGQNGEKAHGGHNGHNGGGDVGSSELLAMVVDDM